MCLGENLKYSSSLRVPVLLRVFWAVMVWKVWELGGWEAQRREHTVCSREVKAHSWRWVTHPHSFPSMFRASACRHNRKEAVTVSWNREPTDLYTHAAPMQSCHWQSPGWWAQSASRTGLGWRLQRAQSHSQDAIVLKAAQGKGLLLLISWPISFSFCFNFIKFCFNFRDETGFKFIM